MIGFILILVFAYTIIQLLGWAVTKLIGTLQLTWADRLGGGALGGVFGIILCVILIAGLTFFYGEDDPTFKNSSTTPYLKTAYLLMKDSIPKDIDKEFQRARKLIRSNGIVAAAKVKEVVVDDKDKKTKTKEGTKKEATQEQTTQKETIKETETKK